MRIEELVPHLRAGGKIKRMAWDEGDFIHLVDGILRDEAGDGYKSSYIFLYTDWEVVNESR